MTAADPSPSAVATATKEQRIPPNHDESPSPDPPPLPSQPPPDLITSSVLPVVDSLSIERMDFEEAVQPAVQPLGCAEDVGGHPRHPSPVKTSRCDIREHERTESNLVNCTLDPFGPGTSKSPSDESRDDFQPPGEYSLKWIKWKGSKTPIITQNENGPCPLIAIMNVLILKGKLKLPAMVEIVTASQLMEYLGDFLLNSVPSNMSEGAQLNYEQNMMDAISILPKLQTGLDVNVRFTSIADFEYTPELIVFDLLQIPLYHGWLLDPESVEVASAVGTCSYNQLVDKIINYKTSAKSELVTEALLAEEFLNTTATQLTYHGLSELIVLVKDDEPSILFRNNHFITLYKQKDCLYQLLTDQGFLNEGTVVWETLNNIEGDGDFVDSDFVPVPPKPAESMMTSADRQAQEDSDYLLALTLQEEDKKNVDKYKEWEQFKAETGMEGLTDEQLAKRLQDEEDSRVPTVASVAEPLMPNSSNSKAHHVSSNSKTALIHPRADPEFHGTTSFRESKTSRTSKVSNSVSSHPHSTSRSDHHHRHHHISKPSQEEPVRPPRESQSQASNAVSQPRISTSHGENPPSNRRGQGSPQGAKRSGSEQNSESGTGRESRSGGKKSCTIQ